MTETSITVQDAATGDEIRLVPRTVGGVAVNMEPVVPMAAGLLRWWKLYAQNIGDAIITLPGSFTAKQNSAGSSVATHSYVLTERPVPSTLLDGVSDTGDTYTTASASSAAVLNAFRFFLDAYIPETIQILGTVRFSAKVWMKDSTTSAATLISITFSLKKLTATDTATTIATVTVTPGTAWSNSTATYVEKDIVATALATAGSTLAPTEKLFLEITTNGAAASGSTCYHKLDFALGTGKTFVEIGVEEV